MKYYLSSFCVFLTWATEFDIIIRFILSISSNSRIHLDSVTNETQVAATINNSNSQFSIGFTGREYIKADNSISLDFDKEQKEIYNVQSKEMYNITKMKLDMINEVSEHDSQSDLKNPKESFAIYKQDLINEKIINNVSSRIGSSRPLDIRSGIDKRIKDVNNEEFSPDALETKDIATIRANSSRNNDFLINNSSRYGFREHRSDLAEEIKIKEFLQKVSNTDIRPGNKAFKFS